MVYSRCNPARRGQLPSRLPTGQTSSCNPRTDIYCLLHASKLAMPSLCSTNILLYPSASCALLAAYSLSNTRIWGLPSPRSTPRRRRAISLPDLLNHLNRRAALWGGISSSDHIPHWNLTHTRSSLHPHRYFFPAAATRARKTGLRTSMLTW